MLALCVRFAALLALLLAVLDGHVNALPTMRTYRGVSPYKALAEGGLNPDMPPVYMPNPDLRYRKTNWNPNLVPGANRLPYGGKYNRRPDWADRIVKKSKRHAHSLFSFAARMGVDLFKLIDIRDPAAQAEAALDLMHADRIWESLDRETGHTVFLPNGTVVDKGKDGLPRLLDYSSSGFPYGQTPVRGVNIGNWLIAEFWMDPGYASALNQHAVNAPYPNAIVDEWTAGQYSNYDYQDQVFKGHYESWFGRDDMQRIAAAGFNHVRIPIGFWAFGQTNRNNEPYRTWNQYTKLIQACGWAKEFGLKVWIDLHGVPGSQNGFDNSGHANGIEWTNDPDNISRTKYVFARLVKTFNSGDWIGTVTAFEAVNEPQGHNAAVLKELQDDYYPWSLGTVKDNTQNQLQVTHDAFITPQAWNNYYSASDAKRVILDTHQYFIYTDAEHDADDSARIREVCALRGPLSSTAQHYATIVGEMCVVAPLGDNGQHRDLPAGKFHFTKPADQYPFSKRYMAFLAWNFRTQQAVFEESGNGWIAWAWRNKQYIDWSVEDGINYGWWPASTAEYENNPLGANQDEVCSLVGA